MYFLSTSTINENQRLSSSSCVGVYMYMLCVCVTRSLTLSHTHRNTPVVSSRRLLRALKKVNFCVSLKTCVCALSTRRSCSLSASLSVCMCVCVWNEWTVVQPHMEWESVCGAFVDGRALLTLPTSLLLLLLRPSTLVIAAYMCMCVHPLACVFRV